MRYRNKAFAHPHLINVAPQDWLNDSLHILVPKIRDPERVRFDKGTTLICGMFLLMFLRAGNLFPDLPESFALVQKAIKLISHSARTSFAHQPEGL